MANLKFYKWLLGLMILFTSSSASAQLFPGTTQRGDGGGIFGNRTNRPVVRQDGSRQWPDGTIQYPDGTTRYPDGAVRYPDGTMSYPRNQRTQSRGNDHDGHNCNMPPGQAKKKYGGHAKDYAKGKKHCKCNKRHDDDDYDDDDDRRVGNYPQRYPQTYPQYPDYPQNRQYPPQQNPNTRTKKGSRTTNPVL